MTDDFLNPDDHTLPGDDDEAEQDVGLDPDDDGPDAPGTEGTSASG